LWPPMAQSRGECATRSPDGPLGEEGRGKSFLTCGQKGKRKVLPPTGSSGHNEKKVGQGGGESSSAEFILSGGGEWKTHWIGVLKK